MNGPPQYQRNKVSTDTYTPNYTPKSEGHAETGYGRRNRRPLLCIQ